jgi:hypothetical protein
MTTSNGHSHDTPVLASFPAQPLHMRSPGQDRPRQDDTDSQDGAGHDRTAGQARTVADKAGQDVTLVPAPVKSGHRKWPLMVIAAPAAVAVWSGWVGLGAMCGFGVVDLLPGIANLRVNTAITLPVGIESYGAYALSSWIGGRGSARTRTFAFRSAIGALALGCLGQVAFHLLAASGWTVAPWPVVMAVACLPVVTLSFAAALVHLKRADAMAVPAEDSAATAATSGTTEDDTGDSGHDNGDKPPPVLSVEEEAARDSVSPGAVRKRRERARKAAADRSTT